LFISGDASIIVGSPKNGKLSGMNVTISVIKPSSIRRTSSAMARQVESPGRRTFLQALAIPPGAKQRLLHRVLGVRQRAEHTVTVEQQLAAMTLDVASELVHFIPLFQRCRWIGIDSYL
jgi:hypothetical protein